MKNFKLFGLWVFLLCLACTSNEIQEFPTQNPSSLNSKYPRLYTDNEGVIHMSWIHHVDEVAELYISSLRPSKEDPIGIWSPPLKVAASDNWFINWADFPSIIGFNGKPMASHWLSKVPGHTYSYNVRIQSFNDDDSIVSYEDNDFRKANDFAVPSFVPHTDGTATEHGFVSMQAIDSTHFYAVWLDGRNTKSGMDHDSGSHEMADHSSLHTWDSNDNEPLKTAMTLRGALISTKGKLIEESEIDASVCDCCNTSLITTDKGLISVYRNRTSEEIRDIYISRYESGIWSTPKAVHDDGWKIAACPVNGPQVEFNNGVTAVVWFTGAEEKARVKLAFSDDYGESFSEPIVVNEGNTLGRVDIVMTDNNSAWISFVERNEETAQLRIQQIQRDGSVVQDLVLDAIDASRRSGFPQMTAYNDGLLVAWTDWGEKASTVRTRFLK